MDPQHRPTSPNHDEGELTEQDGWLIEQPDPTTLIFLWQDDQQPTFTEVHSMLMTADCPLEPLGEAEGGDENIAWNRVLSRSGDENDEQPPIVLWCERAHPIPPEEMDHLGIFEPKWVVGLETLLDFEQPIEDFASLVRMMARGLPDSPAMLDVNTGRWFIREELEEFFLSVDVSPPAELLWIIHGVSKDEFADVENLPEDDDETGSVWLHTHGLRRCGRPELDMLDIPHGLSATAGMLLNNLAENVLEDHLPAPGNVFAVGDGIFLTVHPLQEIIETLPDDIAGAKEDRDEEDPHHTGVRAVVCGERPRGQYREVWTYPREVLQRMSREDVIMFRTRKATERLSALARATWPEFAMAFLDFQKKCEAMNKPIPADRPPAVFILKAGFAYQPADEASSEHVWLRVQQVDGDKATCELMNTPIYIDNMKEGDIVEIRREQISDWSVMTPFGRFEPGRRSGLREALDSAFE